MTLPNKDLRLCYHVACTVGEVNSNGCLETRLSKLCTSPRINQFSKWKPVHYKGNEINLSILQSLNYGLTITSARTADELIDAINSQGTHRYNRPLGGSNSPYRLGDFRNYDPSARLPAFPLGEQDIKNGGSAVYNINNHSIKNPETSTAIGFDTLYPSNLKRGIYMINSSGNKAWCTGEIRWSDIPNKANWQTGKITCYDLYTNVSKTINGAYYPNQNDVFYAVTSDAEHPNPYRWTLTGQRPPDSDKYYFYGLGQMTADSSYVEVTVTMSSIGDVYTGGTANNISVMVVAAKGGSQPISGSITVASSYTIGAEATKQWTGIEVFVPNQYRDGAILYLQVFANGNKQFEQMVSPYWGHQ